MIEVILTQEYDKTAPSLVSGSEEHPDDALAFANFIEKTEHPFAPQFSKQAYQGIFNKAFTFCNDDLNN